MNRFSLLGEGPADGNAICEHLRGQRTETENEQLIKCLPRFEAQVQAANVQGVLQKEKTLVKTQIFLNPKNTHICNAKPIPVVQFALLRLQAISGVPVQTAAGRSIRPIQYQNQRKIARPRLISGHLGLLQWDHKSGSVVNIGRPKTGRLAEELSSQTVNSSVVHGVVPGGSSRKIHLHLRLVRPQRGRHHHRRTPHELGVTTRLRLQITGKLKKERPNDSAAPPVHLLKEAVEVGKVGVSQSQ